MPNIANIEVVTLFVENVPEAKSFYQKVFEPAVVYEDAASCVLKFDGPMVNLLDVSEAPELVEPASIAPNSAGARSLLTVKVDDVDAVCRALEALGVKLLNGPTDRPWGRRTAAFSDPSGHIWELAQELT